MAVATGSLGRLSALPVQLALRHALVDAALAGVVVEEPACTFRKGRRPSHPAWLRGHIDAEPWGTRQRAAFGATMPRTAPPAQPASPASRVPRLFRGSKALRRHQTRLPAHLPRWIRSSFVPSPSTSTTRDDGPCTSITLRSRLTSAVRSTDHVREAPAVTLINGTSFGCVAEHEGPLHNARSAIGFGEPHAAYRFDETVIDGPASHR